MLRFPVIFIPAIIELEKDYKNKCLLWGMENNAVLMNNAELLGKVLDGQATGKERRAVLKNMSDLVFDEFFMVALRATILFNENIDDYDKMQ